jgi:hypothetical protein
LHFQVPASSLSPQLATQPEDHPRPLLDRQIINSSKVPPVDRALRSIIANTRKGYRHHHQWLTSSRCFIFRTTMAPLSIQVKIFRISLENFIKIEKTPIFFGTTPIKLIESTFNMKIIKYN